MELDFSNDIVEKLLFKKVLSDKRYLNIISNVYDHRWFKTPNLSMLFKLVLNYYSKYNSTPSNNVLVALTKKYAEKFPDSTINMTQVQEMINEISSMELAIPEEVLSTNLKQFIRKKALLYAIDDNLEKLETKADDVIDDCLARFDKVQRITFNDADLGLNYFDEAAMDEHWQYINNPAAKVSTGWSGMDMYTNGGFLKDGKSLYVFMGQAGLGKSVFLSNIAVNFLKQGLSVVVISLEMSQDVYATRFDAHISKKNVNQLKENQETAKERIKEFYKEHSFETQSFSQELHTPGSSPTKFNRYQQQKLLDRES